MIWWMLLLAIAAGAGGWSLRSLCVHDLTDEDVLILLAWEAGELSEGQVAKVLRRQRVDARAMREYALLEGVEVFERRRREREAA